MFATFLLLVCLDVLLLDGDSILINPKKSLVKRLSMRIRNGGSLSHLNRQGDVIFYVGWGKGGGGGQTE